MVAAAGSPFFKGSASGFLDFFGARLTGFFAELAEVEAEDVSPREASTFNGALTDLRGLLVPLLRGAAIWSVRVSARKTCTGHE